MREKSVRTDIDLFYNLCFYLFLAPLGLCYCKGVSPAAGSEDSSQLRCGLVTAEASLVAEHGHLRFSSCGFWPPCWWLTGSRAQTQ